MTFVFLFVIFVFFTFSIVIMDVFIIRKRKSTILRNDSSPWMKVTKLYFFSQKFLVMSLAHKPKPDISSGFFSSAVPAHLPLFSWPPSPEYSSVHFVHKQLLVWALSWVSGRRKRLGSPIEPWGSIEAPICHPRPLWTVYPPAHSIPFMTLLSSSQPWHNGNVTASTGRKPGWEPSVVKTNCASHRAEGRLQQLLLLFMCPGWQQSPIEWQWLTRASEGSLG